MFSKSLRAVCLLASFWIATSVHAQMKPTRVEPPPPPAMQAFDPALEPQVTILQTPRGTESEYRIRGKLYLVKVVPLAGGDPYYLLDQTGGGNFVRADNVGPSVQPPQWVISTF
jgi:hypothetical protein